MDKGGLFGGAGTELIYDLSWTISCGGGALNGYMARRGQEGWGGGGEGATTTPTPISEGKFDTFPYKVLGKRSEQKESF